MARNRTIGRSRTGAPTPREAHNAAARHQAEYRQMLTQELGPAVFNRVPSGDDGRPVGLFRLMFRPSGLFFTALTALLVVLAGRLWQQGVIQRFLLEHHSQAVGPDNSWMLGDRRRAPASEDVIVPVPQAAGAAHRTAKTIEPVKTDDEDSDDAETRE